MYVIGQDQELFDEPEKFKPQRWREENTELDDFYNHVPFGFGKRMCIGNIHYTFFSTKDTLYTFYFLLDEGKPAAAG